MSETAARVPEWVTEADGRRVPFETDAICQALFAATEDLGRPDPFLARQLADAVVHFLAEEEDDAPSTAQIAELVAKVVRELGQPALAQAFARRRKRRRRAPGHGTLPDRGPEEVARHSLREYALRTVFSPDLAAARNDGLLVLGGLDTPAALASAVVAGAAAARDLPGLCSDLQEACRAAGQGLVLDSPEWLAVAYQDRLDPEWLCRTLLEVPRLLGRALVFNVHCTTPPAWAQARAAGPLFPADRSRDEARQVSEFLALLLAQWSAHPAAGLRRLDWHLTGTDITAGAAPELLRTAVSLALQGEAVAFVLDRPRRPVALAEGIDRAHPAVLQEVGLDLPAFLRRPGIDGDSARFLEKLPSLARMAVSAGAQKRKFVRLHAAATGLDRGFLLDRARLAVVPLGLDRVVHSFTGQGLGSSPLALDVAVRAVQRLASELAAAGRQAHLDTILTSPGPALDRSEPLAGDGFDAADVTLAPAKQLHGAGALHAVTGHGTAWVHLGADAAIDVEAMLDLLRQAWKRTDVVRVRIRRVPAEVRQPGLLEDA